MPDPDSTAKICAVCKRDCSGLPRVKDRRGRYVCRPCLESRQRRSASKPRAAAADSVPSDEQVMAKLLEDGQKPLAPCPNCGIAGDANAVICLHCGHNKSTGKSIRTRVIKEKEPKQRTQQRSVHVSAGTVSLIVLVLSLALFGFGCVSAPAAFVYFVLVASLWSILSIVIVVLAFMDDAVAGLLTIFLPFYILYYVYARCTNAVVRGLFSVTLVSYLLSILLLVYHMHQLAEQAATGHA